jgi:hypothetical protein
MVCGAMKDAYPASLDQPAAGRQPSRACVREGARKMRPVADRAVGEAE